MVTTSMLSTYDIECITKFADLAYNNDDYEFEIKINHPSITRDAFIRVKDFCTQKTCLALNDWVNTKEQSITLDISIKDFRITIFGKKYIMDFFKTDLISDLPSHAWTVIKKIPVSIDDNDKNSNQKPLYDIGCKLNLKQEINIDQKSDEFSEILSSWKNEKKHFRLKNRYSYLVNKTYSIDLTAVRSNNSNSINFSQSRTLEAKESYEIEIEYVPTVIGDINSNNDKNVLNINDLTNILNSILCSYRNTLTIVPFNILKEVESEYFYTLTNTYKYSMKDRKNLKIEPKVVSLSMNRLRILLDKASDYYVTPKSDGLRMVGFIHSSGELYLIGSKSTHFHPTGYKFDTQYSGTIFDGEFIQNNKKGENISHYLVFDCYFHNKSDIREKNLIYRRNIATQIIDSQPAQILSLFNNNQFHIYSKNFIPLTKDTFHTACNQCFDEIKSDIYENDGLIFTPIDKVGGNHLYTQKNKDKYKNKFLQSGYEFTRLLKWKDSTFNSIDFKIEWDNNKDMEELPLRIENNNYIMTNFKKCRLSVLYDHEPKPFDYTQFIKYMNLSDRDKKIYDEKRTNVSVRKFVPYYPEDFNASYVKLPLIDNRIKCKNNNTWNGMPIRNGCIVEMIYDINADVFHRWIPIRIRTDKDTPNSYKTAIDIWKSYYMPVTIDIMKGNHEIPTFDQEMDTYYNTESKTFRTKESYTHFHRLVVKHSILLESVGKTSGKKLLDLGSGKGGDISRYISLNLTVVGVDNSVDNLHNPGDGAYRRLVREYTNQKNDAYSPR